MTNPKTPIEDEERLGRRAIEAGYITESQLKECLQRQDDTATDPPPLLGQILLRTGYLTVDQLVELMGGGSRSDTAEVEVTLPDRYRILHPLGRGATGTVYLAEDRTLGRTVAIKVLSPAYSSSSKIARRFEVEGRVLARLDHPGIVRVYDAGSSGSTLYIVMECVNGPPIDEYCRQKRPGFRVIAELMAGCAEAVQHAHDNDIIHRDLKPGNILVELHRQKDGSVRPQAKVMDFGLARDVESVESLTAPGTLLGTPRYMSPEQVRGRAADARSDIYALGGVLYALLTGRPPNRGSQEYEIFENILNEDPPLPRSVDGRISPELETICMKALRKPPHQRYAGASDFAQDLRRWLAGEAISARPPSWTGRLARKIRRHRVPALIVLSVLLILLSGGYWYFHWSEAKEWARQAEKAFAKGDYVAAKELFDKARARISVDEELYGRCVKELDARTRIASEEERVRRIFDPIEERLPSIPDAPDGWKESIRLLSEGLAEYDRHAPAWELKGMFHEKLYEYGDALFAYKMACQVDSSRGSAHYRRARLLMDVRQRDRLAEREIREAIQADPEGEFADVAKGRLAVLMGNHAEALLILEEAANRSGGNADVHYLQGLIYQEGIAALRDRDKAIEAYSKALLADPRDLRSLIKRAVLLGKLGDMEGSIRDLSRAIELAPRQLDGYVNRAIALREVRDYEGSLRDLERAQEISANDPWVHANLGFTLISMRRHKEALAHLRKSMEHAPKRWKYRRFVDQAILDCRKALGED